jgi:hypothetical protein
MRSLLLQTADIKWFNRKEIMSAGQFKIFIQKEQPEYAVDIFDIQVVSVGKITVKKFAE